ncbi:MAG: hypothetical protein HYY17_12010 [Planctomycetes bacterium]|nr:hypothetical protein [Planctomycetota bacterium]
MILKTREGFPIEVRVEGVRGPGLLLIPGSMPSDADHTIPGAFRGRKMTVAGSTISIWAPFVRAAVAAGFVAANGLSILMKSGWQKTGGPP